MDQYQEYIALSRYARWLPNEKRRETWEETVRRYFDFWSARLDRVPGSGKVIEEAEQAVLNLEVMPSMRALMTAGAALDRDNVAGFNCSYREVSGSGKSLEILTDEMRAAGFDHPMR